MVGRGPFLLTMGLVLLAGSGCGARPTFDREDEQGASSTGDDDHDAGSDDAEAGDAESGESSESGEAESGGRADLPDDCDVLLQDCPAGFKCIPNGDLDHNCAPILGDGAVGEACELNWSAPSSDSCGAGLICWDLGCTPLCEGPSDEPTCPPGFSCAVSGQFLGLCAPAACDPLQPSCPFDWPCIGVGWEAVCVFSDGASHGDVPVGGDCEPGVVDSACTSSGLCRPAAELPDCAGEACCTGWCDPTDPLACAGQPGTVCVTTVDESYGYCRSP